ncbi:MAG TPA: RES domain-containing protein [Beijerinckiaceae bacterium]
MTAQVLDRVLTAYRIGDPDGRYPIFDAAGSTVAPGRWNTADTPVIYASEHYSTAVLEKLVHFNGIMPKNQHFVRITIPNGVTYERFDVHAHPGWDRSESPVARGYGAAWIRQARSLILLVPSVVARIELNVLINPAHPEFHRITTGLHEPISWDARLLGGG